MWNHQQLQIHTKLNFLKKINEAFNILGNNTAANNHNSTRYITNGTAPVTTLAVCRGNRTPLDCQPCVDAAITDITNQCPHHSSAAVWYNLCTMRYSDQNFIRKLDNTVYMVIWDNFKVPDPNYDEMVQKVALDLSITFKELKARFA